MDKKIEISQRTIVFSVGFVILIWLLFFIRDILLQVFVALLIMSILNPTVTKLHKRKVPRAVSVLIVYIAVLAVVVFAVAAILPPLVEQTSTFATNIPKYLAELSIPIFVVDEVTKELTSQLGKLPSQFLKIGVSVFSNIFNVLTVFILGLYLLLAREKFDQQLRSVMKKEHSETMARIIDQLEVKLGGWARGELVLMLLVGFATYLGLAILGVPYALPLALIAGLLEIVPNIGPFLAAIPAVLVGFGISPLTGVATAALGILVQQVENYLFVPKVMEKSVGVSPIITLLSLIIGFKLAGIPGALLSVPVTITFKVLLDELYLRNR
ncbi:AI-2E family transporter [Candidatus Microgenomates bacterium]|nr:MAG: AI-2E family transporter [Candidatus Microgenomates bacterium]